MLQGKRIYEKPEKEDGYRILVDRLWPRGVKKEDAHLELWAKEIAPSNDLRKAFHQNVENFEQFEGAYLQELSENSAVPDFLNKIKSQQGNITLLTAAKNVEKSHVAVLVQFIEDKIN